MRTTKLKDAFSLLVNSVWLLLVAWFNSQIDAFSLLKEPFSLFELGVFLISLFASNILVQLVGFRVKKT